MVSSRARKIGDLETADSEPEVRGSQRTHRYRLTVEQHPDRNRVGEYAEFVQPTARGGLPVSRLTPAFGGRAGFDAAPLGHVRVSRRPMWIGPAAQGGLVLAPEAHAAKIVVNGEPLVGPRELSSVDLASGAIIELGQCVLLLLHLVRQCTTTSAPEEFGLLGRSDALACMWRAVVQIAGTTGPVLVRGETGSGKELVARAIHSLSPRRHAPFVCVNMATLRPSTAASELFGHCAGAFTGAVRAHPGYFEQADAGTLLLDEVAAAPEEVQSMLLRVLEDGELRPVGARAPRRVDVRILAATDESLESAIGSGAFRAPLYHRLASCTITVPPLRKRRGDIGLLLEHFMREARNGLAPRPLDDRGRIPTTDMTRLLSYPWPGNVRQLRNLAREAVTALRSGEHGAVAAAVSRLDRLIGAPFQHAEPSDAQRRHPAAAQLRAASPAVASARSRRRPEIDRAELVRVLEEHDWRVGEAASVLGLSRTSVYAAIAATEGLRTAAELERRDIEAGLAANGGNLEEAARQLRVSSRALKLRMRALGIS